MIIQCNWCNKLEEHSVRRSGKPNGHCKRCQREYSRKHYAEHKAKHNVRRYKNKKKRIALLKRYLRFVKCRPCLDCNIRYPYYVMQFDHREDKTFTISNSYAAVSIERLRAEIAKCDIVCANCHAERTHGKRDMV